MAAVSAVRHYLASRRKLRRLCMITWFYRHMPSACRHCGRLRLYDAIIYQPVCNGLSRTSIQFLTQLCLYVGDLNSAENIGTGYGNSSSYNILVRIWSATLQLRPAQTTMQTCDRLLARP